MVSELPPAGGAATSSSDPDFAFAFNDSNFSDRTLRIEIIGALSGTISDGQGSSNLADSVRNRKRWRQDAKKDNVVDSDVHPEEQISSSQMLKMEEQVCDNKGEEAVAMVEGLPLEAGRCTGQLGNEAALIDDSSWSMDQSTVLKVKTVYICSAILAAKSPFFIKVKRSDCEEAAFMDLLNFIYSNTLTARTPPALFDVLMVADKFEVVSCMRYCGRLLRDLPMTEESALLYLDLPSSVMMAYAIRPLTEAAKQFLAEFYKDMLKFRNDVLNLPLVGIEAVLANDDLQVPCEDIVYDCIVKWAQIHHPKLEERCEVFSSRLGCLARFPYMSCRKLRRVLDDCKDFNTDFVTKLVLEALFFKAEAPYRQRSIVAENANSVHHCFVERAYKLRPVKVVELELPHRQCTVYLNLKLEECTNLFPAGRMN